MPGMEIDEEAAKREKLVVIRCRATNCGRALATQSADGRQLHINTNTANRSRTLLRCVCGSVRTWRPAKLTSRPKRSSVSTVSGFGVDKGGPDSVL